VTAQADERRRAVWAEFSRQPFPTVKGVARALGLHVSVCHWYVGQLVEAGYLRAVPIPGERGYHHYRVIVPLLTIDGKDPEE
jgi:hypothetical protein